MIDKSTNDPREEYFVTAHHKMPLILDYDPGIDDAHAILMALRHPMLNLRMIRRIFVMGGAR